MPNFGFDSSQFLSDVADVSSAAKSKANSRRVALTPVAPTMPVSEMRDNSSTRPALPDTGAGVGLGALGGLGGFAAGKSLGGKLPKTPGLPGAPGALVPSAPGQTLILNAMLLPGVVRVSLDSVQMAELITVGRLTVATCFGCISHEEAALAGKKTGKKASITKDVIIDILFDPVTGELAIVRPEDQFSLGLHVESFSAAFRNGDATVKKLKTAKPSESDRYTVVFTGVGDTVEDYEKFHDSEKDTAQIMIIGHLIALVTEEAGDV